MKGSPVRVRASALATRVSMAGWVRTAWRHRRLDGCGGSTRASGQWGERGKTFDTVAACVPAMDAERAAGGGRLRFQRTAGLGLNRRWGPAVRAKAGASAAGGLSRVEVLVRGHPADHVGRERPRLGGLREVAHVGLPASRRVEVQES